MGRNKECLTKAARLADLTDYQEDSVVGKTIIDKKAGTITLFAFDQGQGLSEHKAPYDALIHVIDGEVEITVSHKANHLKEGEIIMLPANEPHAVKALARSKMVLTMIRA